MCDHVEQLLSQMWNQVFLQEVSVLCNDIIYMTQVNFKLNKLTEKG